MVVEVRPIKTEEDYEAALKEIESLFDAKPGTFESGRPEVLTALVEDYENHHYEIPVPDPVEAILYYIESRGLMRKDLETYLGSRARVSEILNRKRPLSLTMIRKLNQGLGIPAEVLIQPGRPGGSSHS
jgi:HTH-type transcriptional regulator/antitoxin HigA